MADPLKRRDFIKSLSLAGASIAMVDHMPANAFLAGKETSDIKNDYFAISFDKKKGTINIYRNNGAALLTGGTACINSDSKRYISPGNYRYTTDSKNFN